MSLAAGARWRPDRIRLIMKACEEVEFCSLLRSSRYSFSQQRSGFNIPNQLLSRAISPKLLNRNQQPQLHKSITADFVQSIRELIRSYVNYRDCRIDEVALAVEVSPRTLQRRLKLAEISFNDLLNQEKAVIAKQQLSGEVSSISQIASRLGYSDTSHFDRAFQRWVGVSPREYRKQNQDF